MWEVVLFHPFYEGCGEKLSGRSFPWVTRVRAVDLVLALGLPMKAD